MELNLFSDPHLGLRRSSHTTIASRVKLQQELLSIAESCASQSDSTMCLGDLFDVHTVDNQTLLKASEVYRQCCLTLFGNHDLSNRMDNPSSVEVLYEFALTESRHPPNEGRPNYMEYNGLGVWWVDHKLSQELFEKALQEVYDNAMPADILLLHCNYNSGFVTQASELNLTEEDAAQLLEKVSYIFIGHEHMPRTLHDGRLICVGNTYPTGFSDISDKFTWKLDVQESKVRSVTPTLIWDKDKGYMRLRWEDLSELTSLPDTVQFVEVTGVADLQHLPLISAQVSNIWKLSEHLLMVKNGVTAAEIDKVATEYNSTSLQSIPERISAELKDTALHELWEYYLGVAQ
jgi:DNA repair exonuclease SbcCD nuclease subunit